MNMRLPEFILLVHISIACSTVLAGTLSMVARKASFFHKGAGKLYFYGMIMTVLSAFVLMLFPEYENPVMMFIGIFMLYLVISGFRTLRFKGVTNRVPLFDKILSSTMGAVAILMLSFGATLIWTGDMWGIPLALYSIISIISVWEDFLMMKSVSSSGFDWIKFHALKMIGSYSGAITAILVTQFYDYIGVSTWLIAMIPSLAYMSYWVRKIRTNPASIFEM